MNAVDHVLKELSISKQKALRDYALLNASQRLAELRQKCVYF